MPFKSQTLWLTWTPRVLAIAYALFLALFGLDVFDGSAPLWQEFLGFLIHSVPTFIIIALTVVAWKWRDIGGLVFIILDLAFVLFFRWWQHPLTFLVLGLPPLVIGLLFIFSQENSE